MHRLAQASLAQIPPPPGGILPRNSIQGLANFPSFTPELGSHLVESCGVALSARATEPCPAKFSSKVQRLLTDLAVVRARGEKAVVFSQHKLGIFHLSRVFSEPRINVGHVKIVGGDSQASQEQAVKKFNEEASVSVFLLHAGQAAAGLTLTAASHVFLMEPFMKAGEQAQAMNRCHRIGQTKDVTCTLYFAPDTIEERMEAWKELETGEESDALSVSLFVILVLVRLCAHLPFFFCSCACLSETHLC
jgi:SNF2 family DNA or RNA helicase